MNTISQQGHSKFHTDSLITPAPNFSLLPDFIENYMLTAFQQLNLCNAKENPSS